jgi:ribonuclease P protein component
MKCVSLCENHLFQKAYKTGKKAPARRIVLYVLADKKANLLKKRHPLKIKVNRVGITVSKKIGGAVTRSRVRRILREAYYQVAKEQEIKTGFLLVLVAREKACDMKSTDLAKDLSYALKRLDMVAK